MSTFPTDFRQRVYIPIPASVIDSDLTDFTVKITESMLMTNASGMLDADGASPAQNGGGDIRASSDIDGTTQLPLHVAAFVTDNTPANGRASIYVKVPSLLAASGGGIYLWYNTVDTDTQPAVSDTYGSDNAVRSEYKVFYTTEDSPTGTIVDVTSNSSDGTTLGTMTSGDLVDGAVDGKAYDFDGTDDAIDTNFNITSYSGAMSVTLLINPDTSGSRMALVDGFVSGTNRWDFEYGNGSGTDKRLTWWEHQTAGALKSNTNIEPASWAHAGLVHPGTSGTLTFYKDGAADGTASVNHGISQGTDLWIASRPSAGGLYFNGKLGDIRVYNGTLSAAWINAESINLLTPSTFGEAEAPTTPSLGGNSVLFFT